ncbi:MAG: hypothetical protein ACYTBJ_10960 [Planctomycetota bacterium]|jgi:hypothetical protein
MSYRIRVAVLLAVLGILVTAGCGGGMGATGEYRSRIRFEHIVLNVEDSIAVYGSSILR